MVMCNEPMIFAPLSGNLPLYSSRVAMRPGISCSARRISLRPHSASERSATLKGGRAVELVLLVSGLVAVAIERVGMGMRMGVLYSFLAVETKSPGVRSLVSAIGR